MFPSLVMPVVPGALREAGLGSPGPGRGAGARQELCVVGLPLGVCQGGNRPPGPPV